jgi:predicted nucleic acid-binding Zn ribbon protein
MRKLDRFLEDAIPTAEVLKRARAQIVLRRWPEIVGEFLAARSFPERYDRGTVWVCVEGSAWAQELRMQKNEILHRLRDEARDRDLFVDLRFGVRKLPEPPAPVLPKAPPRRMPDAEESIREIAERRLAQWDKSSS